MDIVKLKPACKDYIWGGNNLMTKFQKVYDGERLAETWELSCHKDGSSMIDSGFYKGKTLPEYINIQGKAVLGKNCERFEDFPILIKFIDAKENLSVQVHPDDSYALQHEGQYGKTEMWYVVDCEEGAQLYYGFQKKISKEELKKRIEENTLTDVLNAVKVKKGDVFFIEAGTIHAIGKGIVIAEIQQNSNVTYRVYDFGRVGADGKPRELHTQKAVEVIQRKPPKTHYNFENHIGLCDYFCVDKLEIKEQFESVATKDSFHSLLILEGRGKIVSHEEEMDFWSGESIFIPADSGNYTLKGNFQALLTYVPKTDKKKYRIGVDLGGTNIKVGIVDEQNHIIAKRSVKTYVERPWQEVVKDIGDTVLGLLEETKIKEEQCISLGLGSPGTVDSKTGVVVFSNNFDWHDIPLKKELEHYISIPIFISNDANCAALGETIAGAAKNCKNAVLLTLGTGVGGGVILDGKIFEGGFAGGAELGHTTIIAGGEPCTCGRKGCLEAYTSATALIRDTVKAAKDNPNSEICKICEGNIENIDGMTAFEGMRRGDDSAKKVVENYINYLGEGIVNFINIFRPEKVILSGGVCNEGEKLTNPLNEYVKKYSFAGEKSFIAEVVRAELGNDAGIIGAAWLSK